MKYTKPNNRGVIRGEQTKLIFNDLISKTIDSIKDIQVDTAVESVLPVISKTVKVEETWTEERNGISKTVKVAENPEVHEGEPGTDIPYERITLPDLDSDLKGWLREEPDNYRVEILKDENLKEIVVDRAKKLRASSTADFKTDIDGRIVVGKRKFRALTDDEIDSWSVFALGYLAENSIDKADEAKKAIKYLRYSDFDRNIWLRAHSRLYKRVEEEQKAPAKEEIIGEVVELLYKEPAILSIAEEAAAELGVPPQCKAAFIDSCQAIVVNRQVNNLSLRTKDLKEVFVNLRKVDFDLLERFYSNVKRLKMPEMRPYGLLDKWLISLTAKKQTVNRVGNDIIEEAFMDLCETIRIAEKTNELLNGNKPASNAAIRNICEGVLKRHGLDNETGVIAVKDKTVLIKDYLVMAARARNAGFKPESEKMINTVRKVGFKKWAFPLTREETPKTEYCTVYPGNLVLDKAYDEIDFSHFDKVGMRMTKLLIEAIANGSVKKTGEIWSAITEARLVPGWNRIKFDDNVLAWTESIKNWLRHGYLSPALKSWAENVNRNWYDRFVVSIDGYDKNGKPCRKQKSPFSQGEYAMAPKDFEDFGMPVLRGKTIEDFVDTDVIGIERFDDIRKKYGFHTVSPEKLRRLGFSPESASRSCSIWNLNIQTAEARKQEFDSNRDVFFQKFLRKTNIYWKWWDYKIIEIPATIQWKIVEGQEGDPNSCVVTQFMNTDEFRSILTNWMIANRDHYERNYKEDFGYYDNAKAKVDKPSWDIYPNWDPINLLCKETSEDLYGRNLARRLESKWHADHGQNKTAKRILKDLLCRFATAKIDPDTARVIEGDEVEFDKATEMATSETIYIVSQYVSQLLSANANVAAVSNILFSEENCCYAYMQGAAYQEKFGFEKACEGGFIIRRILSLSGRWDNVVKDVSEKVFKMTGLGLTGNEILSTVITDENGYSLVDNILEADKLHESIRYMLAYEKAVTANPDLAKEMRSVSEFFAEVRKYGWEEAESRLVIAITLGEENKCTNGAKFIAMVLADWAAREHLNSEESIARYADKKHALLAYAGLMRIFAQQFGWKLSTAEEFISENGEFDKLAQLAIKVRLAMAAETDPEEAKDGIEALIGLAGIYANEPKEFDSSIFSSPSVQALMARISDGDSEKNLSAEMRTLVQYQKSVEEMPDEAESSELVNNPDAYKADAWAEEEVYESSDDFTPLAREAAIAYTNLGVHDSDTEDMIKSRYWTSEMAYQFNNGPQGRKLVEEAKKRGFMVEKDGRFYLPLCIREERVFVEWIETDPDNVGAIVSSDPTFNIYKLQIPFYFGEVDAASYIIDQWDFYPEAPHAGLECAVLNCKGLNQTYPKGMVAYTGYREELDRAIPYREMALDESALKIGWLGREFYAKGVKVILANHIMESIALTDEIPTDIELAEKLGKEGVTAIDIAIARDIIKHWDARFQAVRGDLDCTIAEACENNDMRVVYHFLFKHFVSPIDVMSAQGKENFSSENLSAGYASIYVAGAIDDDATSVAEIEAIEKEKEEAIDLFDRFNDLFEG